MHAKNASARFTSTILLALIAVSLTACQRNWTRPYRAPTIVCEQPPAQQLRPTPKGLECHGTEAQVRTCVQAQHALWDAEAVGAYATEVDKRGNEDSCLAKHRKAGDIR